MPRYFITFRQDADIECATLGSFGLSTKAIARKLGISESQVMYRLRKAAVKRSEYRDGKGYAFRVLRDAVAPKVRGYLKNTLPQRFDDKGRALDGARG